MSEFLHCVCQGTFHDLPRFIDHTYECADWLAYEEHMTEAAAS